MIFTVGDSHRVEGRRRVVNVAFIAVVSFAISSAGSAFIRTG
jgi:hypothetical protein